MNRKRTVLSAILAFSILGPVTVYAASSQGTSAATNSAAVSPSQQSGQAGLVGGFNHPGHGPGHGPGPGLRMEVIASVIGVDVQTMKSDLAAGQTLVQIAATKGMSESTLISKLHDAEKTRLDALVSSGKMTSAQGQTRLANFDAHAKQFVESTHTSPTHGRPHWGVMRGGLIRDSAAALNMTPEALVTELRNGKSIVEVAQSKGVTEAQLTATLTSKVQAKLNANVASGKMTQALADKAIAGFKSHISTVLNRKGGPWLRGPRGPHAPTGQASGTSAGSDAGTGTGTGSGTGTGTGTGSGTGA